MNRFEAWLANKFQSYNISKPLKPVVVAGLFTLAVAIIGLIGVLIAGAFDVISASIQTKNNEIHNVTSHDQSGGITAHTAAVVAQTHVGSDDNVAGDKVILNNQAKRSNSPNLTQHTEGNNSPAVVTTGNNNRVTVNGAPNYFAPGSTFNITTIINSNDVYSGSPVQKTFSRELQPPQSQQSVLEKIKRHIFLAERYGEEWQQTNGGEILFWRGDQADVLHTSHDPDRWMEFTPIVYHRIRGFVIRQVMIYLKIPKGISIKTKDEPTTPPSRRWMLADTPNGEKHYYTTVGGVTEKIGSGVIENLLLQFPNPGTYPVEYILSFKETAPIEGVEDIVGVLNFEIAGNRGTDT